MLLVATVEFPKLIEAGRSTGALSVVVVAAGASGCELLAICDQGIVMGVD